jgi:diguanylate cyclase (GGDEF)-like protein/PAS domain S-box-containing protein
LKVRGMQSLTDKIAAGGLRRQALIRLALVMLAVALGLALVARNAYLTIHEREVAQKQTSLRSFYQQHLPRINDLWHNEAEQTRARIEFARILEEPDTVRGPKLNAFLNAQWEFVQFSNLFITGPSGQTLFRYGTIAHRLQSASSLGKTDWFYDPGARELYRVFHTPLWLGRDGQGQLIMMKTINASVLSAISAPDTEVTLLRDGVAIAGSNFRPGAEATRAQDEPPSLSVDLPWPGSRESGISLRVQQPLRVIFPLREFAQRPLAIGLLFLVFIWLGLGRWLSQTVRRIVGLEAASRASASGEGAAGAAQHMAVTQQVRDEVQDVATAMGEMMNTVENREREQKIYLDTLAMLEEAVLELDPEGTILRASPGWDKLVRQDKTVGAPIENYLHDEDADALRAQCAAMKHGEKTQVSMRLRLKTASVDEHRWVECRLVCHQDEAGAATGLRGVLRDITQTYLHEKQISHMAMHDALTQLPNRMLVEDRLKVAMRLASRTQHDVGICFIDLDHFKNVNDALGHKAGDKLLVAFSERLCAQLRAGDTLARWGGDEFVLLLPDIPDEADIRAVVSKITLAMQAPFQLEDTAYVVTFSMGVAIYPRDAGNLDDLLSEADRAMFYAKAQGRNQAAFYGDIVHKGGGRRDLYIQNHLAVAIQERRIEAWYQPVVCASSGRCVAVEVLARWHDPELGWIGPATFIPMAENLGLIQQLGDQVWQASLAAGNDWRQQGHPLLLSVNISKRQLFHDGFTQKLLADLALHQLAPDSIILEVTESLALLDVENAADRLAELKRAGFHLAIDDFGTGYSSLSQLHEMPVDELKIDISFVRRLDDSRGLSMVQAIISLATTLGLKTVAEGVEDEPCARKLRTLGVDYLQGYHFAQPMPKDDFDRWLAGQPHNESR